MNPCHRHCEEGAFPDEAIFLFMWGIAHLHCDKRSAAQVSGKMQVRPRNEIYIGLTQDGKLTAEQKAVIVRK